MKTRKGELSVKVREFVLLAKALRPLPEKWHGLSDVDTRFRQRYVDLIANDDARRVFEIRFAVIATIRRVLAERGFVEVETPVLHAQAGGAAAKPFETYHNALDMPLSLRIALELHLKRLLVGGFERVFEIGRVFRNEGSRPGTTPSSRCSRLYQAFADYTDMMTLTEELVPRAHAPRSAPRSWRSTARRSTSRRRGRAADAGAHPRARGRRRAPDDAVAEVEAISDGRWRAPRPGVGVRASSCWSSTRRRSSPTSSARCS